MSKMCGAASEVKDATDEIHELIKEIKSDLETKASKKFSNFKAVNYRSQVVAGTNFFVKIEVDNDEFIHVRIFRPLPHTNQRPEVHSFQLKKTKNDALEYF